MWTYNNMRMYRNPRPSRLLYKSTMYIKKGLVALEKKRRRRKSRALQDRTMEPVYHGSYTPALAHTHTHKRIRTCHVLLLFITIIVTTGIVFVEV